MLWTCISDLPIWYFSVWFFFLWYSFGYLHILIRTLFSHFDFWCRMLYSRCFTSPLWRFVFIAVFVYWQFYSKLTFFSIYFSTQSNSIIVALARIMSKCIWTFESNVSLIFLGISQHSEFVYGCYKRIIN